MTADMPHQPPVFNTRFPEESEGTLMLQQCGHCNQVNYPPRELCGRCLADQLQWQVQPSTGKLASVTTLHYSLEPCFNNHLPRRIGSVQLDCGPIVFVHLAPDVVATNSAATTKTDLANSQPLSVITLADAAGNLVLVGTGTKPADAAQRQKLQTELGLIQAVKN